jgi:putative DNA methylase
MKITRKLIEVALPLVAINKASAREKSIRHGHPSTLHLWWARRPLAAARAVIFAQMVDDPSAHPDLFPTEKKQEKERQRLFHIIEDLVQWENTTNEEVLERARAEIWQSWRAACAENVDHPHSKELFNRHKLPAFHDPFAGGGALPLEAQRLGLEAFASDLNPVAVLINKAMIEIPPKFAGRPPVNPTWREKSKEEKAANTWPGAQGLADDVRYYGKWMRDEAEKRIGHLYPKIEITAAMAKNRPDLKPQIGQKLTVIAWLWARTVKSPNPAFAKVDVPLASSFMLCTKESREAYVEPVVEGGNYRFWVKLGKPKDADGAKNGTKLSRGANFQCLMSGTPIAPDHIYGEANAGRMGERLMAIVAEGERGRVYLSPSDEIEAVARQARPTWRPELPMPENPRWFSPPLYGLKTYGDLFTRRQLVALTTFSDLVQEARKRVMQDALISGLADDGKSLDAGGTAATAYGDCLALYLGFLVGQVANHSSSVCGWNSANAQMRSVFARQAIPMVWDYAESNPLCDSSGSYSNLYERQVKGFTALGGGHPGLASQADAHCQTISASKIISTDPPYYDNIGYADLSDFFYVWLRRTLKSVFPDSFATLAVPKAQELVATPYRHGGKEKAEAFFLDGMSQAMHRLAEQAHPAFPVTIYYAFKQSETESDEAGETASTGWDTFLEAVVQAGFSIGGTWPMRTEKQGRVIGNDTNALASSIVLVCRPRAADAATGSRRDFLTALKVELPVALAHLQRGNIAPVDLAQAAIGPGMAVYTRYAKVLDAEGKAVSVREALALINQTLDEVLAKQEGDFDADTRWALAWFEQYGFASAEYGVAETLSKAKNTSVTGLVEAGILASKGGKVHLLKTSELPENWDPATDKRLTVWEMVHHLIRVLEAGGESAAATLAAKMGSKTEIVRELAYRLYTLCERKKRAPEALAYNALVQSWPEIIHLAQEGRKPSPEQTKMFEEK